MIYVTKKKTRKLINSPTIFFKLRVLSIHLNYSYLKHFPGKFIFGVSGGPLSSNLNYHFNKMYSSASYIILIYDKSIARIPNFKKSVNRKCNFSELVFELFGIFSKTTITISFKLRLITAQFTPEQNFYLKHKKNFFLDSCMEFVALN